MPSNHIKRCSRSCVIREMQRNYHYTHYNGQNLKGCDNAKCKATGFFHILLVVLQVGANALENSLAVSYRVKYAGTLRPSTSGPRNESICLSQDLYINVQSSFIRHHPSLETT